MGIEDDIKKTRAEAARAKKSSKQWASLGGFGSSPLGPPTGEFASLIDEVWPLLTPRAWRRLGRPAWCFTSPKDGKEYVNYALVPGVRRRLSGRGRMVPCIQFYWGQREGGSGKFILTKERLVVVDNVTVDFVRSQFVSKLA